MLRFEYMPSDFHPLFLVLGESGDLSALARLVRGFASDPRVIDVREALSGRVSHASLRLVPAGGEDGQYGLMRAASDAFEWRLNAWQAERIADRIDGVGAADQRDGSEIVEVGTPGEIPIKISRGEFTDDFLVTKF